MNCQFRVVFGASEACLPGPSKLSSALGDVVGGYRRLASQSKTVARPEANGT